MNGYPECPECGEQGRCGIDWTTDGYEGEGGIVGD